MKNENIIIGIDLGVTGALAVYDNENTMIIGMDDMPIKIVGTKKRVCEDSLVALLRGYKLELGAGLAIVESVHAMPHVGSVASFSMGHGSGMVSGVCASIDLPLVIIQPRKWKAHYGLLKTKKTASLELARSSFGSEYLTRAKDHNRAEAMLIAALPVSVFSNV